MTIQKVFGEEWVLLTRELYGKVNRLFLRLGQKVKLIEEYFDGRGVLKRKRNAKVVGIYDNFVLLVNSRGFKTCVNYNTAFKEITFD